MPHETVKSHDRLVKSGALLMGAFLTAAVVETKATIDNRRRRTSDVDVISNIRPGMYANWFFPGFHTNMRVVGPNFDRHWQEEGAAHYAVHEESGHSMDNRRERWLEARKKDGFRPARIYAQSMGGMEVFDAFSDPGFAYDFGEVDTLVIDSGVSKIRDVTLSTRFAMAAARLLPPIDKSDKLYHWAMSRGLTDFTEHGPEVTDNETRDHLLSSAATSFGSGRDQIRYIRRTDVSAMDLSEWGQRIRRKVYLSAMDDQVVDLAEAASTFNASVGGGMVHSIDTRRKSPSHAVGAEYPKGVLDNLKGENQDDYRTVSIRPRLAQAAQQLEKAAA